MKEEYVLVKECFTHPPFQAPPPLQYTLTVAGCFANFCVYIFKLTITGLNWNRQNRKVGRPSPVGLSGVRYRALALRAATFCLSEHFLTPSQSTERPIWPSTTAGTWGSTAVKEKKCWKSKIESPFRTDSSTMLCLYAFSLLEFCHEFKLRNRWKCPTIGQVREKTWKA